jgi:hypothetical protein
MGLVDGAKDARAVGGALLAGRDPDGTLRLRADDAAQRSVLHPGESNDLAYLGLAVAGPAELEAAVAALEKHGLVVHRGDAKLATQRAVADLIWCVDPSSKTPGSATTTRMT